MEVTILTESHKDYRTWVYNKIDGEMLSKIVGAEEATELYANGWRQSPAEFSDDEQLKETLEFIAAADDMAQKMNFLINLDKCTDIMALREFAEKFLQLKVHHKSGVDKIRAQIQEKAEELDLFEKE